MPSLLGRTTTIVDGVFVPSGSPYGHWSADTITGLEDGDPVATWPDQSGNSRDLTQATASKRPTYQTNEVNGEPAVQGDYVDDGYDLTVSASDEWSYHFVGKNWHVQSNDRHVSLGNDYFICIQVAASPSTPEPWRFSHDAVQAYDVDCGGDQTNWSTVALVATLSLCNIWVDNTDTAGDLDPYDFGSQTKFSVFCSYVGRNSSALACAELILYNSAISAEDRGTNETGLNTKYSIY